MGEKPTLIFTKGFSRMKKELSGVAGRVLPLIEPAVADAGCTVWDVDYLREGADYVLRITLDSGRDGGVGIDDCERVHRAVDPVLDEADPIENSYCLQVSSPGIERDITLPRHITACTGSRVEARLFAPLDGTRVYTGALLGFEGGAEDISAPVLIDVAGKRVALPYEAISKMKLLYDFDA